MYMLLCGPMFSFLLEIHLGVGLLSVTVCLLLLFFFVVKSVLVCTSFFFLIIYLFILAMPGLNCGLWDLVPWPGIEPGLPALGAQNLRHWTTRETPVDISLYLSSFSPISNSSPSLRLSRTCYLCWRLHVLLISRQNLLIQPHLWTFNSSLNGRCSYWYLCPPTHFIWTQTLVSLSLT